MVFVPSLRLESAGLDPLILDPYSGWVVERFDPGFPAVREVVQNAPDADGTIDTTSYFGARNITLAVILDEVLSGVSVWEMEQRLRAFMSPRRQVRIVGKFREDRPGDPAPEVQAIVRGSQFSSAVQAWDYRPIVAQWVCPSGLIESAELHTATAAAGGYNEQPGREYDLQHDREYPDVDPSSGGVLATNAGSVPVWPTVTMYGPASDGIVLVNDTTGQDLVFTDGLAISAGDWVRIDFAAKTIVNSTGTSYYDTLDFPASTWWRLQPGDNRIFMVPTTADVPPASFEVRWRDGWL